MTDSSGNTRRDAKESVLVAGDDAIEEGCINNALRTDTETPVLQYTMNTDPLFKDDKLDDRSHPSTHLEYSKLYTPAPALASSRYNRQMLIPSISVCGQQKISSARVLIIGLGGLGSPAALYLAGAGVGTLGLLDDDLVEHSNLHRQIVHREDSQGMSKVQSAVRGCKELNSEVHVVGHEMRLDVTDGRRAREVFDVIRDYDIVLDCTDNPATRYLISDVCVLLGKVLVSGAAQRLEGQILVLNYELPQDEREGKGKERGPCYRCIFPTPPSPEMVKGCGEIGVLGPVVGTIGTLMASEAIRLIVKGDGETRKPSMLLYNAWPADPRSMFRTIGLRQRKPDCVACGDEDILKVKGLVKVTEESILNGKMDYVTFCGVLEDVKLLKKEERIDPAQFFYTMASVARTPEVFGAPDQRKWHNAVVVDVREPHEIELGPQIKLGVNIPLSKILRQDGGIKEMQKVFKEDDHDAIIFVCQRGNDSQVAAKKLLDSRHEAKVVEQGRTIFIGDIVGGFAAIDKFLS